MTFLVRSQKLAAWTAALLIGAGCALWDLPTFERAYLYSYVFWGGLSLGCLGFLLIHNLTGGAWGTVARPGFRAGAAFLPWMAVLFIPILLCAKGLYPWAQEGFAASEEVLRHKAQYLNMPFFVIRNAFYFGLWMAMGRILSVPDVSSLTERTKFLSGVALVLFFVSTTFAALDWLMSLEPRWHSSIYGIMITTGFGLTALSIILLFSRNTGDSKAFHDLGNLLLACVMLIAYLAFSQYLIVWNANITDEVSWYLNRTQGGWGVVISLLIPLQLVIPFFYLLLKDNKRDPVRLRRLALYLLLVFPVHLLWWIYPAFYPGEFHLDGCLPMVFVSVGVVWLTHISHSLRRLS